MAAPPCLPAPFSPTTPTPPSPAIPHPHAIYSHAPLQSGDKPASVAGLIEFTDVHFRYPARPTVEVFQGLTLTIPAGRTVALCGESGSGKSTAIALIQRWYDPGETPVPMPAGMNFASSMGL